MGCPIQISTDQRLLAAPRGFSQRATSFIASWCQGIHRMPFSCSRTQDPPLEGSKPSCTGTIHTGSSPSAKRPRTRSSNSACTRGHVGHHNQHIRKTSLIDMPPIARLYPTRCCHPDGPRPVRLRDPPDPQGGRGAEATRSHGSSTKRRVQRRTRT